MAKIYYYNNNNKILNIFSNSYVCAKLCLNNFELPH